MLGYACMNLTLRENDPPLRCNRGMRKKTWESRGLHYASELAVQNFSDLYEILRWNVDHGIYFYRCTSELVPWNSQFKLTELPDYEEIARIAADCGRVIRDNDMRFTFHPDHWCKLASESVETVENSIRDLEVHGSWLDLLGLPRTPYYSINVHIGAHYNDKEATAARFRNAVDSLSPAARQRLTVENDDKEGLWSVPELVTAVAEPLGVPVVFDYHHHQFTSRGLTYREAFELAAQTWGDVRPVAHYSEPARLYGQDARPQAHAEYVSSVPDWLLDGADVMLEAKSKERALLRYRDGTEPVIGTA